MSDPTQRLLTSLGRFQRQFMKAREGAAQEQWSDECMNHLIHGVEIALEQEWGDLVEALTETGRILQSYEDAGRANQCVPFLADSYEILCLMVGDLIVDKVRTGVMRKWRDRYQMALEELASEGIPLVEDEDSGARHREPQPEGPDVEVITPEGSFDDDIGAVEGESAFGTGNSSLEMLGELPALNLGGVSPFSEAPGNGQEGTGVPEIPDVQPERLEAEAVEQVPEDDSVDGLDRELVVIIDTLCDSLGRIEREPEDALGTVFLSMEDGVATLEERARARGWKGSVGACALMARLLTAASERRGSLGDRFFETAYAFGGIYGEARDGEAAPDWTADAEALLAGWEGEPAGMPLEAADSAQSDESPFEIPSPEDSPFDEPEIEIPSLEEGPWNEAAPGLPDGFDVQFPESPGEPAFEEPAAHEHAPREEQPQAALRLMEFTEMESPAAEPPETPSRAEASPAQTGGLLEPADEEPEQEAAVAPETPAGEGADESGPAPKYVEISSAETSQAPSPVDEDPASQLLDTARQAVASGSTASAKLLAMQAAASIARSQAKEAEARVRQAEIRLQETAKSIESARQQVQEAEGQVVDAEARVTEGKEALSERGRHTHGVMGSLDGIKARISDLDRRIQELQAQRDDAERQRTAAETALDEARQQESNVKAHLDNLKNAEQMARVRLEDARGQVKLLQRKQSEIESIMERARDSLTRYRESMADIEETIEQIRSAETGVDTEGDELLF